MAKTIEKTKINSVEDIHNYFGLTGEETGMLLDFKNCDTRKLYSLNLLFEGFESLEKVDILNLDMSTVTDMSEFRFRRLRKEMILQERNCIGMAI